MSSCPSSEEFVMTTRYKLRLLASQRNAIDMCLFV